MRHTKSGATKVEAKIRDEIVGYLGHRGIKATSEKRLIDPDEPRDFAQADIQFTHKRISWYLEVKRNAIDKRTLAPVQRGLGQSLHYLALAPYNHHEGASVRAALVVAAGTPTDTFIETCERAGVEVWMWHNRRLRWLRSRTLRPLRGPLRSRHPLRTHSRKTSSMH